MSATKPVVIDARAAVRREVGGVERVAREMAARLPRLRPERYGVVHPPPLLAHRAGHVWEQAVLPLAARDALLFYCPANLAPVTSRRNVLVIHDVAALRHPEWYGRAYSGYQKLLLPRLARQARALITVSKFSRGEIADVLRVPAERVAVVPNGVGERFSPDADDADARRAHGVHRPYVLVVGTSIGRKNLAVLRDAARALRRLGIELVAAGSTRRYMRAEAGSPVRALGYVEEQHLPGLYAGATAVVMPSLYEGFGLPCLEAMASGTPVVAAARGALPETCGQAALLVDPGEPAEVADAVLAAATDASTRKPLVRAGLERAAYFSWARTAELTDRLMSRLLHSGAGDGAPG